MILRKLLYLEVRRRFTTSLRLLSDQAEVRVRFAPSPTGQMHLGGLRTALYNYIFAKQHDGKFILRIEDTDQARLVPGSAEDIEEILLWAGLHPDESPSSGGDYGPYIQSARLHIYHEQAERLLKSERAYKCFCSSERLELLRKYQSKNREKPRYDGKCRLLSNAEINKKTSETNGRYVIRFAVQDGTFRYNDLIFGELTSLISRDVESDPVIIKSDGFPTYHFANVVDDYMMKISHVLRGYEWISSTIKHIQLYQSLGWKHPQFAHFPLISMYDGSKMSKRNDQSHVKAWRASGYLPDALLNFLLNMGGGVPKVKQDSFEFWNLDTIIERFDFGKVIRHPGTIDMNKLNIYNAKGLQELWKKNPSQVLKDFERLLIAKNISTDLERDDLTTIMNLLISRVNTINDFLSDENRFIWSPPTLTFSSSEYVKDGLNLKELVTDFIHLVEHSNIQNRTILNDVLVQTAEKHRINKSALMMFLRRLLTDCKKGLPIHEIVEYLGKERLLIYLHNGLHYVSH